MNETSVTVSEAPDHPSLKGRHNMHNRLRFLRLARGLTQMELGNACSVTGASVGNWELGKSTPSTQQVKRMADELTVHPDWLLYGTGALAPEAAIKLADVIDMDTKKKMNGVIKKQVRKEYAIKLGDRLREAREKAGVNQVELADIVECSSSHISALEKGKVDNPSVPLLRKIADTLDTTVSKLMDEGCDEGETTEGPSDPGLTVTFETSPEPQMDFTTVARYETRPESLVVPPTADPSRERKLLELDMMKTYLAAARRRLALAQNEVDELLDKTLKLTEELS